MASATGIVDHLWIYDAPFGFHQPINRQAVPNKPSNRDRRKKLSLILLEALVQELLKQIAKELVL